MVLGARTGRPTLPGHIRVADQRYADVIASGVQRSATLQRMVDRIGELDGIIYVIAAVEFSPGRITSCSPALFSHEVTSAGMTRILRIVVGHDEGDAAVSTIAHELQHATEVLEDPGARSRTEVTALFVRIGREVDPGVWETVGAENIERTVAHELRASRSGPECDAS